MNHKEFDSALKDAQIKDNESFSEVPWNEIKCMQDYISSLEVDRIMLKLISGVFAFGFAVMVIKDVFR